MFFLLFLPQKRKIHPHLRETQSNLIPKPPHPPSVSPFSGSHLEHRVFPPSPGAPGGGSRLVGPPSPPPLFLISLGEVAISGDLGFFPAGFFAVFSWYFFSVLESPWWLRGGVLVASWTLFGGAWEGPSSSCCCWGPAQLPVRRNSKGEFSCPGWA